MELRRLVQVLTAQGRLARWMLTALPLVLLLPLIINPDWLDPLLRTNVGQAFLVLCGPDAHRGSSSIKKSSRSRSRTWASN